MSDRVHRPAPRWRCVACGGVNRERLPACPNCGGILLQEGGGERDDGRGGGRAS